MQFIIESFINSALWLQLIRFLLGSTLLLGSALLIDRLRLIRRLSLLSWLWHGTLAGSLLLLVPLSNPLGFTLLFRAAAPAPAPAGPSSAEAATDSVVGVVPAVSGMAPAQIALLLWGLGSAILLLRLFRLARKEYASLGDRSAAESDAPLFCEFTHLSQNMGIGKIPRLSLSKSLDSAITLPFREVCLPAEMALRDPASIRGVLAHELSHIKHRDVARLMTLQVLACVLFFQPLFRIARNRLADIAEFQADRRAVEQSHKPEELARALLNCANQFAARQPIALSYSMHGNQSRLRSRIEQIMGSGEFSTQPTGPFLRITVLTAIAVVVAFAPGFSPGPDLLAAEFGPQDRLEACDSFHYELVVDAVHEGRVSGEQGLAIWEKHCGVESGDLVDSNGKKYGLPGHHLWYMARVKPMDAPYLSEVFKHGDTLELSLFQNWLKRLPLPSQSHKGSDKS